MAILPKTAPLLNSQLSTPLLSTLHSSKLSTLNSTLLSSSGLPRINAPHKGDLAGRKNTRYAPLCLRDFDALQEWRSIFKFRLDDGGLTSEGGLESCEGSGAFVEGEPDERSVGGAVHLADILFEMGVDEVLQVSLRGDLEES